MVDGCAELKRRIWKDIQVRWESGAGFFDTYWKLSDSIDKLREEVWDADDSFHRDVNRIANELEIIRLEEIRVPDTIGYDPSGGKTKQLGIKDIPSDREAGAVHKTIHNKDRRCGRTASETDQSGGSESRRRGR